MLSLYHSSCNYLSWVSQVTATAVVFAAAPYGDDADDAAVAAEVG